MLHVRAGRANDFEFDLATYFFSDANGIIPSD